MKIINQIGNDEPWLFEDLGGINENELIWKYGKKLGLFEWEGLKLGIELCADSGSLMCKRITNLDLLLHICCGFGIGSLTTSINP